MLVRLLLKCCESACVDLTQHCPLPGLLHNWSEVVFPKPGIHIIHGWEGWAQCTIMMIVSMWKGNFMPDFMFDKTKITIIRSGTGSNP